MAKKWILVADTNRAKVLLKNGKSLTQIGKDHLFEDLVGEIDKGAAKPGRARQVAPIHVYEPHTELQDLYRQAFAKELAKIINSCSQEFERFVMIAPPALLGELRKNIDHLVQEKIEHEIPKDLTHLKLEELEPYLATPYV